MKKAVVLSLVLFGVLSPHLFAETLDCQQSFELGKTDAKSEHRLMQWYGAGAGFVFAAWVAGLFLDMLVYDSNINLDSGWSPTLPIVGAAVTLAVPFGLALWSANRTYSYPVGGELDKECYRDGYRNTLRWRNSIAVLVGELMVVAGFVAFHVSRDLPFPPPR
jgi:hypothetical protein